MKILLKIFFLSSLLMFNCSKEKVNPQPNILFIFADDLSYEAISGYGNPVVKTPNIDKLMSQGTSFSHAYNMGGWNGAICVASRAMLMSGRSIWRAQEITQKWRDNDKEALEQNWATLMQSAGYQCYMTGKWHVAAKADSIFETAAHIRPGMPGHQYNLPEVRKYLKDVGYDPLTWNDNMPAGYNRPLSENDHSWSPSDTSFGGFWEGGIHWSEVVANDALLFMDEANKKDNPFFMYLAFNAPHDHRQASQKYIDMYPLEDIVVPDNFLEIYPYHNQIGCEPTLRDEALAPFPRTPYAIKVHLQEYYAIISHMDNQIGRILEGLEKSGKAPNTHVIFTADHGLSVGHHGLLGKQSMYDHSVRVPFVIKGPDIPKGNVSDSEIYLQDAMATSLELAGMDIPEYVDFRSLLSDVMNEEKSSHRETIIGFYTKQQRMIRKNGFKLIVYPNVPKLRLFDMKNDPLEMNDLSDQPKRKELINILFEELKKSMNNMGDELVLKKEDYKNTY